VCVCVCEGETDRERERERERESEREDNKLGLTMPRYPKPRLLETVSLSTQSFSVNQLKNIINMYYLLEL